MTTQPGLHMNNAFQSFRMSGQHETRELNNNLRDMAGTLEQFGEKLDEADLAPAAPPGDKPPAPAPVQAPPPHQPIASDKTPCPRCPFVAGLPKHWLAASGMPAGDDKFALPTVPDYSGQLADFVSTVIRNQDVMMRTLAQALDVCRRQEQQFQDLARQFTCMAGHP